jgi:F420-dependent oxidoreductase-like protein
MLGTVRIGMTIGGDALARPSAPPDVVADARRAEDDGFATAWTVHMSRAYDALTALAVAGTRTARIELGVGVVPTYPRHPLALAQQAVTVQTFCGGRLTLGVGVSHRPVIEELHGLSYASPAAHMREYLTVLGPLLRGEAVTFAGEHYRVDGGFAVPGAQPVSVLVGGLSPKMVRVAGELTDGVITWLVGPRSIGDVATTLQDVGGGSRLVAALPVAVHHDADDARAAAEECFARYNGLENYRRQFVREGVPSVGALAVVGSETEVEKQLRHLADLGVTDLWPVPFPVGATDTRRTRELLASQ